MKKFLLLSLITLTYLGAVAQSPNISFSSSQVNLVKNASFSLSPTNSGAAVPATSYGSVTTIASIGKGYANGGALTAARFNSPQAIAVDAAGNLYIADANNNDIRMITPAGVVSLYAGSPTQASGSADSTTPTSATFNGPDGLAFDAAGNLFVGDYGNARIRKITPAGVVTTFVQLVKGASGLSFDPSGNLWAAEQGGNKVVVISPAGAVTNIAGNDGAANFADGTGTAAGFDDLNDVEFNVFSGNIYAADYLNNNVRIVTQAGVTTTVGSTTLIPGTPAVFGAGPYPLVGTPGFADGIGHAALFNQPTGVVSGPTGLIYVCDFGNAVVRNIKPNGLVTTVAGVPTVLGNNPGAGTYTTTGTKATLGQPVDMWIDPTGSFGYFVDAYYHNVRKIILNGYGIDKALPAGFVFDPTTGTISGTPTTSFLPITYTVTAYNGTGWSDTQITLSCVNNWLGNSTTWSTGSNWSFNVAPVAGDVAEIGVAPYVGASQPTLSGTTSTGALFFGTNNTPALTIASGTTLNVAGFTTTTGIIGLTVNAASTATVNGPGTMSLTGTSVINTTGSLTASSNSIIALAASSTLTNSGTFILGSDVNGSASIAAIPSTSSVAGQVTVQRYVQANRAYRLMSSPVNNGTANYSVNYLLTNTYLTGTGGTAGGFSKAGNPTLYLYRENLAPLYTTFLNSNFIGISNIATTPYGMNDATYPTANIPVGSGYLFYYRGSSKQASLAALTVAGAAATTDTLNAVGTLNQGSYTVHDWYTPASANLGYTTASGDPTVEGFNLVGNPYASSIDWDKLGSGITSANISGFSYKLIPTGLQGSGTYDVYQTGTGGVGTRGTPNANIIASGEGFFVQATGAGASLTFTENAKSTTQVTGASLYMAKTVVNVVPQYLRLQLALDTINTDGTIISFTDNSKTTFDPKEDAVYKTGTGKVSLSSLSSDNAPLAINQMPLSGKAVTIALKVSATANGTYSLNMKEISGIPQVYAVFLKDAYTKDSVNMRTVSSYSFTITLSDTTTFGSKRFSIALRPDPAFAYQLTSFAANKVDKKPEVQLVWKTQNEANYTHFTVERSNDNGKTFEVIGGLLSSGQGTYSLLDKAPLNGVNQYHLKQVDYFNTTTYSNVVEVIYADKNTVTSHLSVYPNPASSNFSLSIVPKNTANTTYSIRVTNSTGMVVKTAIVTQPVWDTNVANLLTGTYLVQVTDAKDNSLVGQTKFVKL